MALTPIARSKEQADAGLSLTDARALNKGLTNAQIRTGSDTLSKAVKVQTLSPAGVAEETSGDFSRANPGLSYTAEDAAKANAGYQYIKSDGSIGTTNDPGLAGVTDADPHSGTIKNPPGLSIPSNVNAAESATTDGITSTSGDSRKQEKQLGLDIASMFATPGPDMSYLDSFEETLNRERQTELQGIERSYDSQQVDLGNEQQKETGSTSAQIARLGGYLGESGSASGVLQNLATSHRAEQEKLESLRVAALTAARKGYMQTAYDLAQERTELAKSYAAEAQSSKQKFFETAQKLKNEQAISSAMASGAKTSQQIFDKLGGSVSIEDIGSYLDKSTTGSTSSYAFSKDEIPKLLGSGFSQSDIEGVEDFVSKNGYTDALRATLTPRERTVLDSIYYPKTAGGTGVGGTLSIAEAKSLGLPTSLIGRGEAEVISDLNSPNPPVWFKEYITSGWADPNAQVDPTGLAKDWQAFRSQVLSENINGKKSVAGSGTAGGDLYDTL